VVTAELESLCKAFAGLCKLERRRGRSIVGVLCMDLVLAALSKADGRRPRAGHVLQYLRILSRAYPGALASASDEGNDAAMEVEQDDGLRVLGRSLRLLITAHLGDEAKANGSGAKRERIKIVDDCLSDMATDNSWTEDNATSLEGLLEDVVGGIGALPQHNGDGTVTCLRSRTRMGQAHELTRVHDGHAPSRIVQLDATHLRGAQVPRAARAVEGLGVDI
jgi:hypothetical protein